MKVLIVKTSSLGDIIHTLPALTDAGHAIEGLRFDWVVEEGFAEIPSWHPLVKKIIPIAWRRWRKDLFSPKVIQEMTAFLKNLRMEKYDLIIDAQGLVKSAFFSCLARGKRCGLDWSSTREKFAALFYQRRCAVVFQQHAVIRARSLFSQILGYSLPPSLPDYGIDRNRFKNKDVSESSYLVFLHGTTWESKHWPDNYWLELSKRAAEAGFCIKFPWGNIKEKERAQYIAANCKNVEVLPSLNLRGVAAVLANAKAIVSVDTGLGHLAAALNVPTVSLYGPTDPAFTGAMGQSQIHLRADFPCSPCFNKVCNYQRQDNSSFSQCFSTLQPPLVWEKLAVLL